MPTTYCHALPILLRNSLCFVQFRSFPQSSKRDHFGTTKFQIGREKLQINLYKMFPFYQYYKSAAVAINSATSITSILPSCSLFFTPSVIIVLQKGQPVAIILGLTSIASSVRLTFTSLSPFSASLNICAFPASQHVPFALQFFISTSSASNFWSISLGAS